MHAANVTEVVKETQVPMQLEVFFSGNGFLTDWIPADRKLVKGRLGETEELVQREWYQRFERDKYRALFELGVLERQEWMTPSVAYLCRVSKAFMMKLSSSPDIEVMRGEIELQPEEEEIGKLLDSLPFAAGAEICGRQLD